MIFKKFFQFIKVNILKLMRIKASPHQISLGFALGIWSNFLPIFGIHLLIAVLLSYAFRSNQLSSILGSLFGSLPIIFPFFWFLSWYVGSFILSIFINEPSKINFPIFLNDFTLKVIEMIIGSIILFPIIIIIIYFPFIFLIIKWKKSINKKTLLK